MLRRSLVTSTDWMQRPTGGGGTCARPLGKTTARDEVTVARSTSDADPATPLDFDRVDPDPAALIESLRAFGYTPEAAVADLIDNSITAKSKKIWIEFDWAGADSRIAIGDDGTGMTEPVLVNAMRPGSTSPSETRDAHDLGRFGLGLKTASFSQCRQLTVISKAKRGRLHARRWDLDEVVRTHEWRLIRGHDEEADDLAKRLDHQPNGTVVVWQRLDHVVGNADPEDEGAHRRFLELARSIKAHLAMTFHRYMGTRAGLAIELNGHPLPPWDPFLSGHRARQVLPAEKLPFGAGEVAVQPFVLPHRSKLSGDDFEMAGGERGWNSLQGFYVYRNRRLLVAGDWLGLGIQKEEHYKLARIQVDITNDMDLSWQIDVRKSMARPPGALREELRRIARATRSRAVEVYRHRGKAITRRQQSGLVPMWEQRLRHGKITYHVNRDHPVVEAAMSEPSKIAVRALLSLVEETVPVPLISISNAERPEQQAAPFEGETGKVAALAVTLYDRFRGRGMNHEVAKLRTLATDPFQYFPELVEVLDAHAQGEPPP